MKKPMSYYRNTTVRCCVVAIALLATAQCAYGLRMTQMPEALQTKDIQPIERSISLKLPLLQPVFHWRFLSTEDLLAGKLVLHIRRDGETSSIIIFENGKFLDGWIPATPPSKDGAIYFGFQSRKKYLTAPGDEIEIELTVKKDLDGIGSLHTGVLPAGKYKSKGAYSGLIDEYNTDHLDGDKMTKEMIEKVRSTYEYKAFLENWQQQWPLKITSDKGWMEEGKRAAFKKQLKEMEKADK